MEVETYESKADTDLVFPGDIITTETTFMRFVYKWKRNL